MLAEVYRENGKNEQAMAMYRDLLAARDNVQGKKELFYALYKMYKGNNMPDSAYASIEKYLALQDSSYHQILNGRIADYEVLYQTAQKKKLLLEKDLEITRQKQRQKNLMFILLIMIATSIFLFIYYRRKMTFEKAMNEKDNLIRIQQIKELEHQNRLLALGSMIEGQESERVRIARDLHDGLGGLLATVKAHFTTIENELNQVKNFKLYEKTNQLIDEACAEVRRIAHDMIPNALRMNGLEAVLSDVRDGVRSRGMGCNLEIHRVNFNEIDEQRAAMIYRIVQELVANAIKHAGAGNIFIQLVGYEKGLNILVEDDGQGFDVNQLVGKQGLGLRSVESRVKFLGGELNIDSALHQGTTVNIYLPFEHG